MTQNGKNGASLMLKASQFHANDLTLLGLKLTVKVEIQPKDGLQKQKVAKTKAALKEPSYLKRYKQTKNHRKVTRISVC